MGAHMENENEINFKKGLKVKSFRKTKKEMQKKKEKRKAALQWGWSVTLRLKNRLQSVLKMGGELFGF